MGKKHKKESKKRKHRSRSRSTDKETEKDKRKHHKRHHKLKKKEKCKKDTISVSSQSDDDVVYVPPPAPRISKNELSPPPAPKVPPPPKISSPENPPAPPPPTISASSDNSLSIEQTNALRAKLGLKPLAMPKAAPPSSQTENASKQGTVITSGSEEFVHKPAENLGDKKETEKIRERLAERKAKREIEKKLSSIATLAQASDDDESASAWVKKSRKITEERFKAEQKAKELDEMDEVFGIGDLIEDEIKREKNAAYTAANLKGLKVDHDLDGFSEGKSVILTLKDKEVLADEEDALVNVNMIDDERYKKNVANKNLKPFHYNGIDPGEMDFDEPKTVLSKYDEEIDGVKKTSFKIGEEDVSARKEAVKQRLQQKTKMKLESLSLPEPKIASEYYTPTEMIKIKKPKKKKKIRSKMLRADDLLQANGAEDTYSHLSRRHPPLDSLGNGTKVEIKKEPKEGDDAMDIDEEDPPIPNEEEPIKVEIEDDAELQLALKKARRLKQMPPERVPSRLPKVEEVLEQIKEEPEESDPSGTAIVLNSTAEFCRTLGDIPTYGLAGNRDEDPGVILDFETERDKIKKLDEEIDDRGGWNDVAMDEKVVEIRQAEAPILDAEPDLGSGISGALRMAMSKGYLEKEATSRPSASRFAHLAAQNYSIDDKAHAVEDEKLGRRERYLGPTSDFKEKDGYKPNIKLEYIDDDGHILSAKEAFRYLSHKFHGKGPGKNKVEKRMKKNEQEGLMKQMSSTDTPLGTLQMLQQKQKETQSAFVVLSGSKQTTLPPSISKTKMLK